MEEKGQVSCQGYKVKLVIAAGVTVKKKKKQNKKPAVKSRMWGCGV